MPHRLLQRIATSLFFCLSLPNLIAQAGEPPSEPILRIETGMHTAAIMRIGVDADGRWLLTASEDKTARLWDVNTGKLLTTFRPPIGPGHEGKLYAGALSPDGRWVALGGYTGWDWQGQAHIYLFDRASGHLLRRLGGLTGRINQLTFSPNNQYLAVGLKKDGIRLWRTGTWVLAGEDRDYGGQVFGLDFHPDSNRLVASSFDGDLRLYRAAEVGLSRPVRAAAPGGMRPLGIRFAPDGRRLAVGYFDTPRVDVLDADDLSLEFTPDLDGVDRGDLSRVAWSERQLLAGGRWWTADGASPIRAWANTGRGPARTLAAGQNSLADLASLRGGGVAWCASDPAWGVLDVQGNTLLRQGSTQADFRDNHDAFRVSSDSSRVRFGYEVWGKSPTGFDLATRRFFDPDTTGLTAPRIGGLEVQGWKNTTEPTLVGQSLALEQFETSRSLAIAPDSRRFALGTDWFLRLFDAAGRSLWKQPAPGEVWGVNIPADGKRVVAAYADGTIRWHRLSDGKELLAFFPHLDKKRWVLWTPAGYFDASPGAEDLIGWHINQGKDKEARFVTGGQLYSALYRPDLIQRVVQGEDPSAFAQVDLEKLLASGDAPKVEFLSPASGSSAVRDVTLRYRVCDAGGGIGKRLLRLNGIAIALAEGNRGLKLKSGAQARDCLDEERLISLQPGENSIAVTAYNKTGQIESLPVELNLTLKGGLPAGRKPTLHVLALAIEKYRDGDLRLNYPKKDAEGLIQHLKTAGGKLFDEIKVHTLFDDTVRRGQIADAFGQLSATVQPEDVFVLYLAGHGVTDREDGNYYFLPVDFRFTDEASVRQQALSNAFFQENMAKIRAGKSLVLLDTCNSGSFQAAKTRGIEEKTAMARLVKATGRATLMASSSAQVALEGYQGHGVFTWALIEGLKGKAASRDNQITVGSLADYVGDTLPELTYKQFGYEQVPQRELQGMNFAIGVR